MAGCSNSSDPSSFYRQYELSIKDSSFEHFVEHLKDDTKPYGNKIILSFAQEGCAQCEHQIEFIKDYLEQNKQVFFYAVFVDAMEDNEPIFKSVIQRQGEFFESAQDAYNESNFYKKNGQEIYFSTYDYFVTPTNIYIDLTSSAPAYTTKYEVSEAYTTFNALSVIEQMVDHNGMFGAD